jgi:hypothetical protein
MAESEIEERIDAWQTAGLIDDATAQRLRDAELERVEARGVAPATDAGRQRFGVGAAFGPGISVGEVFGYLGAGFLLGSWYVLLVRLSSPVDGGGWERVGGTLFVAAVLALLALRIREQSPRFRRAAGVALLASAANVGYATWAVMDEILGTDDRLPLVFGAVALLMAGAFYRRLHAALLTQVAVIVGVLTVAWSVMGWLEPIIFGPTNFIDNLDPPPDSVLRPVLIAIGWAIAAVALGGLGLREERGADFGAGARAAVTRVAAGLTAVLGTASAVFASGVLVGGEYGRLIPPIIGDAVLIAVSAILLERAFRREASAFVLPAALGVIIGLSDLNANYLAAATSQEIALLVEGAILLAAGFAFDRLRRRVGLLAEAVPTSEASPEPGPA